MAVWADWCADLFDAKKVPFSRKESFLAISWLAEDQAFWLRNLRGGDEHTDLGRMLRLTVLDAQGDPVDAAWTLHPDCLSASIGAAWLRFVFDGPDRIAVAGHGLGLRLQAGASKYNYAQGRDPVHICIARQDMRCNVFVPQGTSQLTAPWNGLSADQITLDLLPDQESLSASLDLFRITPGAGVALALPQAQRAIATEFDAFLKQIPDVPADFAQGRLLAAYILWSGYVPAEGALSLPSIYMSKNWMTNIWSWDHCFVALAFAKLLPDRAFEQMAAIFAAQDASGRLPDYINDRYAYWAFTKPPVHGWTFAHLRATAPDFYTKPRLRQVLGWLAAQVEFWLAGPSWHGLPAYRHGNDAGWDNASCFAEGGPLVGPDLATFLILQLDEIAALHAALGETELAKAATVRADALCTALCEQLWQNDRFGARLQIDGKRVQTGQSLLLFLPLLLGERLPAQMRTQMLKNLFEGSHLTRYGLATEATDSALYRSNGYWRGPIWAPTTALFVDALRRCGEYSGARDIARRYLDLCNAYGMAENHDAVSGQGLHDPAFAWTSATFLALGASLLD